MASMDKIVARANTIELINANIILKKDLDRDINDLSNFWMIGSKKDILEKDGLFGNYWVITKNSTTSDSTYELYCGKNITSSYVPSIIFIYENDSFKGVLTGDVIRKLILIGQNGVLSWEKVEKPHVSLSSIHSGSRTFMSVGPGIRIQRIDHVTGRVTEIPNQFPGLVNISQFQRADTIANAQIARAQQDRAMAVMNTPGISLGAIGANLHLFRFN